MTEIPTPQSVQNTAHAALGLYIQANGPLDTSSWEAMLVKLCMDVERFKPFATLYDFERAILQFSHKHPVGFLAICFAALEQYFPSVFKHARFGDVLVPRFHIVRPDEQYKTPPPPPDSPEADAIAMDVIRRERANPVLYVGGLRIEPHIGPYRARKYPHIAVALFDPWRALTAYVTAATAQMHSSDTTVVLCMAAAAVDYCPVSCAADFLPRLYRAAGDTEGYRRAIQCSNVRPFAGNFLRLKVLEPQRNEFHEKVAIDRYGYTRWFYLKLHLDKYSEHYAL